MAYIFVFADTVIMVNFAIMNKQRLSKSIKALVQAPMSKHRHGKSRFDNPRRYRLDFIAENTLNRVWTLRFSRLKVILASIAFVASIGALMFVILFFSPVSRLLPGRLEGDLRSRYINLTLRLDSIERRSAINDRYLLNLRNIITGELDTISPAVSTSSISLGGNDADSLLSASEAERRFVTVYEASDRFNLSVLTPIAAGGMAFYSPVPDALTEPVSVNNPAAVVFTQPDILPVSAAYRGTVISVHTDNSGESTVIVQHPNDFVSIYGGLYDCFTLPGARLVAGERIGHSGKGHDFRFELWHNGTPTDPTDYIGF